MSRILKLEFLIVKFLLLQLIFSVELVPLSTLRQLDIESVQNNFTNLQLQVNETLKSEPLVDSNASSDREHELKFIEHFNADNLTSVAPATTSTTTTTTTTTEVTTTTTEEPTTTSTTTESTTTTETTTFVVTTQETSSSSDKNVEIRPFENEEPRERTTTSTTDANLIIEPQGNEVPIFSSFFTTTEEPTTSTTTTTTTTTTTQETTTTEEPTTVESTTTTTTPSTTTTQPTTTMAPSTTTEESTTVSQHLEEPNDFTNTTQVMISPKLFVFEEETTTVLTTTTTEVTTTEIVPTTTEETTTTTTTITTEPTTTTTTTEEPTTTTTEETTTTTTVPTTTTTESTTTTTLEMTTTTTEEPTTTTTEEPTTTTTTTITTTEEPTTTTTTTESTTTTTEEPTTTTTTTTSTTVSTTTKNETSSLKSETEESLSDKIKFEVKNYTILSNNSFEPNSYSLRIRIKGFKWNEKFANVSSSESQDLLRTKILPLLYKSLNLNPSEINEVKLIKLFKGSIQSDLSFKSNSSLKLNITSKLFAFNGTAEPRMIESTEHVWSAESTNKTELILDDNFLINEFNLTRVEDAKTEEYAYNLTYSFKILASVGRPYLCENTLKQLLKHAVLKHFDGRLKRLDVDLVNRTRLNTNCSSDEDPECLFPIRVSVQFMAHFPLTQNEINEALNADAINKNKCKLLRDKNKIECLKVLKDATSLLRISDYWIELEPLQAVHSSLFSLDELLSYNPEWIIGLGIIGCVLFVFFLGCVIAICYTRRPYRRSSKIYELESAVRKQQQQQQQAVANIPNMYPTTRAQPMTKYKEVYY